MAVGTLEETKLEKAAKRAKREREPMDKDQQIKAQLRAMLQAHADELDDDDRAFAEHAAKQPWTLLTGENTRAVLLLARFQAKSNAHAPQVAGEDLLPAQTAATVPAGIERRKGKPQREPDFGDDDFEKPPERPKEINKFGGAICRLSLKVLDRHPDNREPLASDVEAMVESIKIHGLLEPIIVRAMPKGRYQILSGETRVLAYRKMAGKGGGEIDARVRACSDAQALELLAEFNATRKDLSAIDKARLIARLCEPKDKGGAGLTREQAARIYGLESGGAASNLVRLLELPKAWQDRVAAGELEWTWAREILKAVKLPPVMEQLEDDWKQKDNPRRMSWQENAFDSRVKLSESIDEITDQYCRRLDSGAIKELKIDANDPQVIKRLGIVEVELPTGKRGQTETVKLTTNEDAVQELFREREQRSAKSKAEKAGRDKPAPKRELTTAERKEKASERTKTRNDRIAAWRHKLLRKAIANVLQTGPDNGLRLVMAYAADPCASWRPPQIHHLLETAMKGRGKPRQDHFRKNYWPLVMYEGTLEGAIRDMALQLLADEGKDWRAPTLPHGLVEDLAGDLAIDVATTWRELQETGPLYDHDLLEEFFLLHQTEELRSLCAELKVVLPPSVNTRAQMVKLLLSVPQGSNRRLPLPKSIKPVAGEAKPKGKKR